jgi:thiamine-phosphate pyrophosphorylase
VKLHVLVEEIGVARTAVEEGATVVQLRLKGASTDEVVERGRPFLDLPATFVVDDDVEAALRLGADGVHLGQEDTGVERALAEGLLLGLSATTLAEAIDCERRGAAYIGAGPIWATPSKRDAAPPMGLDGLAEVCRAVSVPVVAIGGIDATNAGDCIRAGAAGVAVIRAASQARELVRAIDAAAR